jgi:hypothetical protein
VLRPLCIRCCVDSLCGVGLGSMLLGPCGDVEIIEGRVEVSGVECAEVPSGEVTIRGVEGVSCFWKASWRHRIRNVKEKIEVFGGECLWTSF